mgnify:CR=1 FL=1
MDHEEQRIGLVLAAAEELLSVTAMSSKDLLDGLADRPRSGAKRRAREALTAHLKALGEFRTAVSRFAGVAITGSAAGKAGDVE